ncbi:MAG TPA: hypothetical protein VEL07_21675 [Planctomycetota bacterium]|nr:hypothetical protein [Planctomycetota bacterium]
MAAILVAALGLARSGLGDAAVPERVASASLPALAAPGWARARLSLVPDRIDATDVPAAFSAPVRPAAVAPPVGASTAAVFPVDPIVAIPPSAEPPDAAAQRRELTAEAARWVARWEGRRHRAYTDLQGNRAVGIGCNLDNGDAAERLSAVRADYADVRGGSGTLTDRQIDRLFAMDLERALAASERLTPDLHEHPLVVRLLVIDLVYTAGPTGFSRFGTTREALARRDYATLVAALPRTRWYRQTGRRAQAHIANLRALIEGAP